MNKAFKENKIVELTLQTYFYKQDNEGVLYKILDGQFDKELTQYARDIKKFGHPILFRLNNEMNGDWCAYSSYHHSKDTEIYKEVWKHFYKIFDQNGVNNVLWVWNPNHESKPGFAWNHSLMYYPGDQYVDIVGLTAYNTGTYYKGETWNNFYELYKPLYKEYTQLSEKPLMITEFGSSSYGGDKIQWIQNMFANIHKFPEIKVAIWWSGTDWDTNKNPARIYRLDESKEMLNVFKLHLKNYK
ncbi:glycoside hydrolase family 26 protein [Bacillus sp. Marseille-P3661]|uniref:glycoside hydrolase family 26 protein n=1 Tax=Bacillus sp. Marseille-P3661 TaxID=1936234 RepID=UPI00115ACDD1|nr:glycosyl hydrolase [Bacillus sp. Marseille-P3661]